MFIGVIAYILTVIIIPTARKKFFINGWLKKNYSNKEIPIGFGIIFIPVILLISFGIYFVLPSFTIFLYTISLIIMGLVGFYDDIKGDTSVKGLKGHFRQLQNGIITSGMFKAIIGSAISIVYALFFWVNPFQFLVNFFVIVLFANTFNLFDLRPGRCIKVFLFISSMLILIGILNGNPHIILLYPLLGIIFAYAPFDFKEKVMLGDAGANMLGLAIGLISILITPFWLNFIFLLVLLVLHWYTEKNSLNTLIQKNYILRKLDDLGRIT